MIRFGSTIAYLKLTRMVKAIEIDLHLNSMIEILQELSLKRDDFLDITKQRVDLRVRQEGLTFKGLQVVLQQII